MLLSQAQTRAARRQYARCHQLRWRADRRSPAQPAHAVAARLFAPSQVPRRACSTPGATSSGGGRLFATYSTLLETRPLATKSFTSGLIVRSCQRSHHTQSAAPSRVPPDQAPIIPSACPRNSVPVATCFANVGSNAASASILLDAAASLSSGLCSRGRSTTTGLHSYRGNSLGVAAYCKR